MMLTCPMSSCDHAEQPDVGTLAAHLVEFHLLAPSEAMRKARESPYAMVSEMTTPKEARPMAADDPIPKKCSFCKRGGHVYSECSIAKAHRKNKKSQPFMLAKPKPAASVNGFAGVRAALRAERDKLDFDRAALDAAILTLERLEARGR